MALPGAWTRQVKGSSESVLPIGFGVFESCFAHLTYPGRGAEMISRYDPFLIPLDQAANDMIGCFRVGRLG